MGLVLLSALFLMVITYLVATSLARREQPVYEPSPVAPQPLPPNSTVLDTLTVDARDARRWRFVDLDRRSAVLPPDTAGWDLAFRRFRIIAGLGVAPLGSTPFDSIGDAPETGYAPNLAERDTVNPVIERWYRYSYATHLLMPNGRRYAVRTAEGRAAVIEILSYYCEGLEPGCVTFRYRYPLSTGSSSHRPGRRDGQGDAR